MAFLPVRDAVCSFSGRKPRSQRLIAIVQGTNRDEVRSPREEEKTMAILHLLTVFDFVLMATLAAIVVVSLVNGGGRHRRH